MREARENLLRQGLKRHWSPERLRILGECVIGVAGAGGLGSNAALMLARSGVERFVLADDDRVEPSNLNRQQYRPIHVGMIKVEALRSLILELNPDCEVVTLPRRITPENVDGILPHAPIWLEALDGARDKRMFVEAALTRGLRVASASGMAGHGGPPMRRRRLGRLIVVGDFVSDVADAPPLAPRVTEAAALLADAALEFLLGPPDAGKAP